MRSATPHLAAALVVAVCSLAGCSLVTIESPQTPLSDRDMNARISTHRFVEHFISKLRDTADRIAGNAEEEEVVLDAIRWKIGATVAITLTGFQTSPRDALVDSWAYCAQMTRFFRDGAGSEMFGAQHELALATSAELEEQVGQLARKFAPIGDASRWQEFVLSYATRMPLVNMATPRESSVTAFYEFMGIDEQEAIETVGTLGQVLNDFGSRIGIMGDQLPKETAWRTELFLLEQGIDGRSLQEELELLGARMERVAVVAEHTPELIDTSLVYLQKEVATLIEAIGFERVAAMEALGHEREILVKALSKERAATMEETRTYLNELVENIFSQASGVAAIVLFGLCALVLVLFGVPFGVGVLVGRLTKRPV
jgi:hypothetical protein